MLRGATNTVAPVGDDIAGFAHTHTHTPLRA